MYRFLNGRQGLDLEVGTSIFFFVTNALCHSSFGYFADLEGRPAPEAPSIREMIRAGYVDTIHAYGDFDAGGFTRNHARRILEECETHALRFPLWTNHGSDQNLQNIGHRDLHVYQCGDDPACPDVYHLDLLRRMGVEFIWVDDGYQNVVAEGSPLLYEATARDGSNLTLIRRYRGLVGKPAPNAGSLAVQVTRADLDRLIELGEACIYYQHLGVWEKTGPGTFAVNTPPYFDAAGLETLEYLAEKSHSGDCLVSTPGRLCRYLRARDAVEIVSAHDRILVRSGGVSISEEDLEGISLVMPDDRPRTVSWEDAAGTVRPIQTASGFDARAQEHIVYVPWSRLPEFAW